MLAVDELHDGSGRRELIMREVAQHGVGRRADRVAHVGVKLSLVLKLNVVDALRGVGRYRVLRPVQELVWTTQSSTITEKVKKFQKNVLNNLSVKVTLKSNSIKKLYI